MADEAASLCARAERELALRNVRDALVALEKAYVPVQTTRDLGTVRYALTLTQKAATSAFNRRDARKARRIAEWYVQLERSYTDAAARPRAVAVTEPDAPPQLEHAHEPEPVPAPPEPVPEPQPEPEPEPEPELEPEPEPVAVVEPEPEPVQQPTPAPERVTSAPKAATSTRSRAREANRAPMPLAWINRLIPELVVLTVVELVVGAAIALIAHQTEWRIAAAIGSIFWASVLVSVIALLRMLQRVEQNTRPAPRSSRSRRRGSSS